MTWLRAKTKKDIMPNDFGNNILHQYGRMERKYWLKDLYHVFEIFKHNEKGKVLLRPNRAMPSWKLSANAMQITPFLARHCLFRWSCQTIWCHVNWSEALTKTNHTGRLRLSESYLCLMQFTDWNLLPAGTRHKSQRAYTLQIHHNTKHKNTTQHPCKWKKNIKNIPKQDTRLYKSPKTQCKKEQSTAESHENRADAAKFPISLGFTTRVGQRAIALTLTWILAFLNLKHRFIWLEIFDISILPSGTLATVHWKVCSAKSHLCFEQVDVSLFLDCAKWHLQKRQQITKQTKKQKIVFSQNVVAFFRKSHIYTFQVQI